MPASTVRNDRNKPVAEDERCDFESEANTDDRDTVRAVIDEGSMVQVEWTSGRTSWEPAKTFVSTAAYATFRRKHGRPKQITTHVRAAVCAAVRVELAVCDYDDDDVKSVCDAAGNAAVEAVKEVDARVAKGAGDGSCKRMKAIGTNMKAFAARCYNAAFAGLIAMLSSTALMMKVVYGHYGSNGTVWKVLTPMTGRFVPSAAPCAESFTGKLALLAEGEDGEERAAWLLRAADAFVDAEARAETPTKGTYKEFKVLAVHSFVEWHQLRPQNAPPIGFWADLLRGRGQSEWVEKYGPDAPEREHLKMYGDDGTPVFNNDRDLAAVGRCLLQSEGALGAQIGKLSVGTLKRHQVELPVNPDDPTGPKIMVKTPNFQGLLTKALDTAVDFVVGDTHVTEYELSKEPLDITLLMEKVSMVPGDDGKLAPEDAQFLFDGR